MAVVSRNRTPPVLGDVLTVNVHIINSITPNTTVLVQNPVLVQGQWTESPNAWDPPSQIPWQKQRTAEAEGQLPTGVEGLMPIRIGTLSQLVQLNFVSNINQSKSDIDGQQWKYIDGFYLQLSSDRQGNLYRVTLKITGDG